MSRKPGLTIWPATSITRASGGAVSRGPTALMRPSTIATSATASMSCARSTTRPPRSNRLPLIVSFSLLAETHLEHALLDPGLVEAGIVAAAVEPAAIIQAEHIAVERTLQRLAQHAALGHVAALVGTPAVHDDPGIALANHDERGARDLDCLDRPRGYLGRG